MTVTDAATALAKARDAARATAADAAYDAAEVK